MFLKNLKIAKSFLKDLMKRREGRMKFNPNRTFGVEIETHANVNRQQMERRLKEALVTGGFPSRRVEATHYGHAPNGLSKWLLKPDASVLARTEHPNDMEVVSPVLNGLEGMKELKVVCDTIKNSVVQSRNCGLHTHHGINELDSEQARNLFMQLKQVEDPIFYALPPSRQANSYCQRIKNKTWSVARSERRLAFNFQSYF